MKSFKEFLAERSSIKAGTLYRIAQGETGPNKNVRFKKTSNGWEVSKDAGKTWEAASEEDSNPLYNTQDIEAEVEIGSIEKV